MNRSQLWVSLLMATSILAEPQESAKQQPDCQTLKYGRHKVSCLCGEVSVCAGDICAGPAVYGLDDDIDVLLRDKLANTLQSEKLSYETQRKFCFDGQREGEYQIVVVLHKRGVAQPAVVFPTSFKKTRNTPCPSIYMVEPICPK
jgi:hypothetical protein